jgi:hypothetical protein
MEVNVGQLFERYARLFNQALDGRADMDEVAALYAPELIGAAPAGVTFTTSFGICTGRRRSLAGCRAMRKRF